MKWKECKSLISSDLSRLTHISIKKKGGKIPPIQCIIPDYILVQNRFILNDLTELYGQVLFKMHSYYS